MFLDYDNPANQKAVTVTIECYDQGQLSVSANIDMVITDVNEPPTDIVSQTGAFEIEENNSGGKLHNQRIIPIQISCNHSEKEQIVACRLFVL